jgi:hypothetical protein
MNSGKELYRQWVSPHLALFRLQAADNWENDVADYDGIHQHPPDEI